MCKGPYLTILALLAFLTVAGAAASLEARFYPDHLQVEEGSSGNAMLVVSGSDVETDLTLSFHSDGVTIDAPGRIHVVPGRTTSTEIMFGAGGKGTFPVTVRVGSPSASAEATILVTTSTEGGITVVARERDYDGDGYREDVEIYVHRSDDEDVAIPNASIEIDGESVGRTDEKGLLKANDFVEGDHDVRAEWGDWSDKTTFHADEPPVMKLVIRVFMENYTGQEWNDAVIYVNISRDGMESPAWGASVLIDNSTDYLRATRTDINGRVEARDIPVGSHTVQARLSDYWVLTGQQRFFSFGNHSPEDILVDAETWADDLMYLNDVNVTARSVMGPVEGLKVRIPLGNDTLVEVTDADGVAHFWNLERGQYEVILSDNGTDLATTTFWSEGTGDFEIRVDAWTEDNDLDGYHDDLVVRVTDPHGPVKGATIWMDGRRLGRTDEDGFYTVDNLEAGDHEIRAVHQLTTVLENTTSVYSYGMPDLEVTPNLHDMVAEPGSDLPWNVFISRSAVGQKLLGTLTVSISKDSMTVDSMEIPIDMSNYTVKSEISLSMDVPDRTGEYLLEILVRSGRTVVRTDPIHLYVYYTTLDVEVRAEETFLYGEVLEFGITVTNQNPGPAVIFDPQHLPSTLLHGVDVVDLQKWDGHLYLIGAGEVVDRTIVYRGDQKLYPSGNYVLQISVSPFVEVEVPLEIVTVEAEAPQIITQEDTVHYTVMAVSGILVGFALFRFEVSRIPLLMLFFPLYTRMRRDDVLDHFLRGRIFEYIKVNPGVNFSEILRYFDLNNGTLTYHLNVLEREKYIKSIRDGVYRRYYLSGTHIDEEHLSDVKHRILRVVQEFPGISQSNIAKLIGASRRLVNYHIKALEGQKVIEITREGRNSHVYLRKELDLD